MTALRSFTSVAAGVLISALLTGPVAADDRDDCKFSEDASAFDACSRLIASGKLRGQALAEVYDTRGSIYRSYRKDPERALTDYTAAIPADPKNKKAYYDRGYIYYNQMKDLDRAIADYTEAIRIDPKYHNAYQERGEVYRNNKDYDRAIADFNEAIRLDHQRLLALFLSRQRLLLGQRRL